jgi:hypothetical protein
MPKLSSQTHKNHVPNDITTPCMLIGKGQGIVVLATSITASNIVVGVILDPAQSGLPVGSPTLDWWSLDLFKPFHGVVKLKSE